MKTVQFAKKILNDRIKLGRVYKLNSTKTTKNLKTFVENTKVQQRAQDF